MHVFMLNVVYKWILLRMQVVIFEKVGVLN